ncbi:MAG: CBS domain-containing protein [Chloroflexota bacterium]
MEVRDLMQTTIATVPPRAPIQEVARVIVATENPCALVVEDDGRLLGLIAKQDIVKLLSEIIDVSDITAQEVMIPRPEVVTVSPEMDPLEAADLMTKRGIDQAPVVEDDRLIGVLTRDRTNEYYWQREADRRGQESWERKAGTILKALHDGLIVVDRDLIIREFNESAGRLTGLDPKERLGQKARVVSSAASPIFDVLATGQPLYNVETPMQDGSIWVVNYLPIIEGDEVTGVVQTFTDVTEAKRIENQLRTTKEELDKAFALTLPNSRVEYKLKTTPEYRDEYDPETGLIRITEVIEAGNYIHVVNALKVAADLNDKGVMHLIGINKDDLVQAIIFHDLGKSQPELEVGSTVDPRAVFEEGRLHALRSSDIAGHYYGKNEDVVTIIKYHHHPEEELPPEFPSYLLPMLRLFKVIDGLSAALTRRNATIELDRVGSWIHISERNAHPDYNRCWELNLVTGERRVLENYPLPGPSPIVRR